SGGRNYLNELYILRSYPLIQSVVEDLDFDLIFYLQGNLITSEAYDLVPVKGSVINTDGSGRRDMIFRILDERQFQLETGEKEDRIRESFTFGDTINVLGLEMVFTVKDNSNFKRYIGTPFLLVYSPSANVAGGYVGRLNASWAEAGAGVINLSLNGPNPVKDIDFLTGLIRNYQRADEDKKKQSATNAILFIESQLREISDSLQRVELQVERFKDQNVVTDMSREAYRLYEKLEELELEKAQLGIKKNYYQYVDGYIRKGQNLDQVILPSSIGINDPILT